MYTNLSSPNKGAYSSIPLSDPEMNMVGSIAGSYFQAKVPVAVEYSKEKFVAMKKYAEEGDWTWRVAGCLAGILLMVSSFFAFLSNVFGFSPFAAILNIYLFCFGLIATFLEYKESVFPESWLRSLRREALFLYQPYGRAAFYFFIGILEITQGGMVGLLIGAYTAFIGAIIFHGSRKALRALKEIRDKRMSEADVVRKFHEFDKDGSGYISAKELGDLCASLGHNLSRNDIESALFILDTNRDGEISLDEFKYWWCNREETAV